MSDRRVLERKPRLLFFTMVVLYVSFFTFFPYLTLLLHHDFQVPMGFAGLLAGSVLLISSVGGFFCGRIVDRYGAKPGLVVSGLLSGFAIMALILIRELSAVIIILLTLGVLRAFMEPSVKSFVSLHDDGSGSWFRYRYLALVAGSIVGPLASLYLEAIANNLSMFFAGGLCIVAALVATFLPTSIVRDEELEETAVPQRGQFVPFVVMGAAFFVAFSQLETTLPLHLTVASSDGGENTYRILLLVNGLSAALLVPIFDRISKPSRESFEIVAASMLMAVGIVFLFFGAALPLLVIGIILFTIGEIVLLPLPDIMASRRAKGAGVGAVMGLMELRFLGFFIGPAIGGYLIEKGTLHLVAMIAIALFITCWIGLANSRSKLVNSEKETI